MTAKAKLRKVAGQAIVADAKVAKTISPLRQTAPEADSTQDRSRDG